MKKNLRSLLCGLLALVLVCSCSGAAFAKDNGATPVISVHGMGGSGLYLNPSTEDEQPVGVFDAKSLLSAADSSKMCWLPSAASKRTRTPSLTKLPI